MSGDVKQGSWTEFNEIFEAAMSEEDMDTLIAIVQKKANAKARNVRESGAVGRDDVASEIVIKVFRYLPKYDPTKGKPSTWVNTIAESVIKNTYRDNALDWAVSDSSTNIDDYADLVPSQASLLDLLEVEFELFAKTLTEQELKVAKLRMQGRKNVEIADQLGITKQRVGAIVEQIRTKYMSD